MQLVEGKERKIPLTYSWVPDEFLGDHLVEMAKGDSGTRKTPASQVTVRQPRRREMLGEVFRRLTRRFLTPGLTDITCGFKAFRAAAAERIFAKSVIDRWSFDAEILFLALRWGMTVREVPVEWRNSAESKVRLWLDLPRSTFELLRIRAVWLTGGYRNA